ncbi:MAG: flagellar motor protein MotB [Proteobacteria bacterium]|nr:flagellar motor protein MotB [Pseudomonadota bacterium]
MAERPDFGGGAGGKDGAPIIIKRIKKGGHGHHGGAWKVAYADFVTAMMAFFLLLWLLNAVTEQQLNGVADYFTPIAASTRESGAGGMLGGQAIGEGASQSQTGSTAAVVLPPPSIGSGGSDLTDPAESARVDEEAIRAAQEAKEQKEFEQVQNQLKQQISGVPDLAPLAASLMVDNTPEGVRIQLMDQDKIDMFEPGSATMYQRSKDLLKQVAQVIRKMPNKVSITGHTDPSTAVDPSGYTNWELSSDRALATRRVLLEGGIDDRQIGKVVGVADREPLDRAQLRSPRNRRVSIVLLRAEDVKADTFDRLPNFLEKASQSAPINPAAGETLAAPTP